MSHLKVGLLILSLLVILIDSKIVKIDIKLLQKNSMNIAKWIAGILLGVIIKSLLK